MSLFKKLVIIRGSFEIIGMVQFLSNQFLGRFMTDCDNGFIFPADVMYGEVVPYGKKFSEWHGRATNKYNKARQSVVIDGLFACTRGEQRSITTIAVYRQGRV